MTAADAAAIIAASASLVAAIGSTVSVLMSLRNGRKIEQVHLATNSMKDELVKVTGEAKFAEGVKHAEDNGAGRYDAGVKQGEDHPRSAAQQKLERK